MWFVVIINYFPINLDAEYLSTLGERLQDSKASSAASAGGRTGLWQEALSKVVAKPLGWTSDHYAHNLWLDTAKVGGVLSLVLLLWFNTLNLNNIRKILTKKE